MMFARCPACQTVFRVRPEQLSARHGEVRCGHCFNPFNALDHLLTEADASLGEQHVPHAGVPEPGTGPLPDEHPTVPLEPTADRPAANEYNDPALDFEIPEVWRSPREQLKAGAGTPLPADLPHAADEFTPPFEAATHADTAAAAPPSDFDSAACPVSFESSMAAAGAGRIEPSAVPPADELASEEAPLVETDSELPPDWRTPADAPPADEHLDARYGPKPGAAPGRRWLWSLGVGVMLGALAVQSAYVFRLEITRSVPMLRPLYLAACAQFGCTLPLPRDAEQIGITTSDLQSDPRAPGSYLLNATVRNRADYPQEWPHLELTLTDAQDRALVRRVLDPAEWAHAETAKLRAGFPAGREQPVALRFDASGVQPVGYRLYIFYP